jgi:hypothetical protein
MDDFLFNFKTLCVIIAKSASTAEDCPLSYSIIHGVIEWVFQPSFNGDNVRAYQQYKDIVNEMCEKDGTTMEKMISSKDRGIFKYALRIPNRIPEKYQKYMSWYVSYMVERMPQKHVDMIFRYIRTLNSTIPNVDS